MSASGSETATNPGSPPSGSDLEERKYLLEIYRIFADQIIKEDDLINHRVTWGIAFNGGLVALLGAFYQAFKEIPHFGAMLNTMLFVTMLAGIFICVQTISSTTAADQQLFQIRAEYKKSWQAKFYKLKLPPPFAYIPGDAEGEIVLGDNKGGWPRYIFGATIGFWIFFWLFGIQIIEKQEGQIESARQCRAIAPGANMDGAACATK